MSILLDVLKCTRCKEEKPSSEFYGPKPWCRPCHKIRDAMRPDRSGVRRNDTPAARARKLRYSQNHRDPIKQAARQSVKNAIASGLISVPDGCETCGQCPKRTDGARAVQAHHDDYAKPLVVRWLCAKCHTAWHKENDAALPPQQGG